MKALFPVCCLALAAFHTWHAINIDQVPRFSSTTFWLIGLFCLPLLGSALAAIGARAAPSKRMPWIALALTAGATYAMYPIKDFAGGFSYLTSLVLSYVVFVRASFILARHEDPNALMESAASSTSPHRL